MIHGIFFIVALSFCLVSKPFGHTTLFISISFGSKNIKSLVTSQVPRPVVTLPVPDSFNGPVESLTKEWPRPVGVTQDGFRHRTAGTAENELMEKVSIPANLGFKSLNTSRQSGHVETALPHAAVPKRAEPENASRPVNKLPPEPLFQVFDFVGPGLAILPLAQVCRRWRGRHINLAHIVVRYWGVCAFGPPVLSKVAGLAVASPWRGGTPR
jgi:hypothetical protein